jgi:hypothetical protein
MRAQRNALREEWAKMDRPPLIALTGINAGLILVGNLGSKCGKQSTARAHL